MRIKKILSQHRRDFRAIYDCEHCGLECENNGYDDANFHKNVIPMMVCPGCGERASSDYKAMATKYPEGQQV